MISPRVLFVGDFAEAAKYVGVAKKFARSMFDAGIISKVWQISDGVSIRVINNIRAQICKVWIEAAELGGYQFYTTSPTPQWATWNHPASDFYPGGSAVYVPTPKLVMVNDEVDYDRSLIYARPTGSLVELPPTVNDKPLWGYWPMPSQLLALNELMQKELFPVQNVWQINGLPEHQWFHYPHNSLEVLTATQHIKSSAIFDSWVQTGGQVHGCGAWMPIDYSPITDHLYDAAPAKMAKRVNGKSPDTDWYGRACIQAVNSTEFGARKFIILSAADGVWHCYPVAANQDVGAYEAAYARYGEQAYKASVVPEQAQAATPVYPEWVSPAIVWRESYLEDADRSILEPRYCWSFNAVGTRAISVMVERKDTEATFAAIDYTPAGLGSAPTPYEVPYLPQESAIAELLIDPSFENGGAEDPQKLQTDRRGFVELEFSITLDGPNLADFSFSVEVLMSSSPDELDALDKGALVELAYAMPIKWNIDDLTPGGFGSSLTNDGFLTGQVSIDDILSVWIELYRHQDQIDLINAYDGEMTLNIPSKTKATFYKNYPGGSMTPLFRIPLSQAHGHGYTYAEGPPEILPPPPHPFVRNTDATFQSGYPYEPEGDDSAKLYYYTTKISHLDLRSLSFYCTTRLIEKTREPLTIFSPTYAEAFITNQAKTYCLVCVMGKVIDEYSVGSAALPDQWIKGWIREAGNADLDEDEFKTPIDYRHSLRGIGKITKKSITPFPDDGMTLNFPWGSQAIGTSWVNSGDDYATPDYIPSPPWWWLGPCGRIFGHVLAAATAMEAYGNPLTANWVDPVEGPITGTWDFQAPGNLSDLVDDLEGFLDYVYDAFSTVVVTSTITTNLGTSVLEWKFSDLYTENPFPVANPLMSKADFIASLNNGYLARFIKLLQGYYQNAFIDEKDAANYMQNLRTIKNPLSLFVFPRGGGDLYNPLGGPNYNKFTEFSYADAIKKYRKGYRVVNYELGAMYYNSAINYHFSTTLMDVAGAIVIRPEGHISYCKKDLFDFKVGYSAQVIAYEGSMAGFLPERYFSEFVTDGTIPTIEDLEWKSVDGLSWYYGKLKTKHLSVYNLAYQTATGEDRKAALRNEELYDEHYTETQFMPDFRLINNHASFRWIYPFYSENGSYEVLERMTLPLNDGIFNGANSRPASHDPRPKKTYLRLSPLFF